PHHHQNHKPPSDRHSDGVHPSLTISSIINKNSQKSSKNKSQNLNSENDDENVIDNHDQDMTNDIDEINENENTKPESDQTTTTAEAAVATDVNDEEEEGDDSDADEDHERTDQQQIAPIPLHSGVPYPQYFQSIPISYAHPHHPHIQNATASA